MQLIPNFFGNDDLAFARQFDSNDRQGTLQVKQLVRDDYQSTQKKIQGQGLKSK